MPIFINIYQLIVIIRLLKTFLSNVQLRKACILMVSTVPVQGRKRCQGN